jgi:hypothetical protein
MQIEQDQGSPIQKCFYVIEGLGAFHNPPTCKQGDAEPGLIALRSSGGKSIGNICRPCIRDAQDDRLLHTSDMGVAPWFSGAKWRSPQEGSVWSIKNTANCQNLVEQMNEN